MKYRTLVEFILVNFYAYLSCVVIVASCVHAGEKLPLVVVGSSAAGTAAIKKLCVENSGHEVIWISEQKEMPYNTVKIGSILKGSKKPEEISIFNPKEIMRQPIIKFGRKVIAINPHKNMISLDNGEDVFYQKLFWATGTRAGMPSPCQKANLPGVFCFGKLADARSINEYLKKIPVKAAVVVGFGLNGAELADILTQKKVQVHVVDRNDKILHNHITKQAEAFLRSKIEQAGVKFHLATSIRDIEHNGKQVTAVVLANKMRILCQLIVFTGINKINSEIAKAAGIKLQDDSILVDNYLRTNIPAIFAGGDNILVKDLACNTYKRSCKWSDAQDQGATAASNMLGRQIEYPGSVIMQHSRFFGYSFVSCGCIANPSANCKQILCRDKSYYHLFLHDKGILKGVLMISKRKLTNLKILKQLIKNHTPINPSHIAQWLK